MKQIIFLRCAMLIFLAFIIGISLVQAQTVYRSGYVVDPKRDTIVGEILYRGDLELAQKCDFRNSTLQIKHTYYPGQIISYGFEDNKKFVSKEFEGARHFFEHFFSGDINFYYLRESDNSRYFLEKHDSGLVEIPYSEEMVTKDNRNYKSASRIHFGLLTLFTQDAPGLKGYIYSIKKPNHYNLKKLGVKYHKEINRADQFEIHEAKNTLFMIFPEPVIGFMGYKNIPNLIEGNYMQSGILLHAWMPGASEKLFFKTGLLYSRLQFEREAVDFYKIPIHLEFIAPRGIVRPRFSVGANVFKPRNITFSTTGGVNVNVHRNVSLGLTVEAEYEAANRIFSQTLIGFGGFAGLFVKF